MAVASITEVAPLGDDTLRVSIFDDHRGGQVKQTDVNLATFLDFNRFVGHLEDKGFEYVAAGSSFQEINRQSLFESWKPFELDASRRLKESGSRYRSPARQRVDRIIDEVVLPAMNDAFKGRFKASAQLIGDACCMGDTRGPSVHVPIHFSSGPNSISLVVLIIPDPERIEGEPHGRIATIDTLDSAAAHGDEDERIRQWLRGAFEKCRERLTA